MKIFRSARKFLGLKPKPASPFSSADYWDQRYRNGGNSGPGSYNHLARFKAEVLDSLVKEFDIRKVMEFGCGDGNQLALAHYPNYVGLDVSEEAINACRQRFPDDPHKQFRLVDEQDGERAELCISIDVIFHLVEDEIFDAYMARLFSSAERYVVIYSSNSDFPGVKTAPHVRHRSFSSWIDKNAPEWKLARKIQNQYPYDGDDMRTSFADFYVYARG